MPDFFARATFLFPRQFELYTKPLSSNALIQGDADFRGYGNNFPDSANRVTKEAKELPENLRVTGTVSFADSYVKMIGRDSSFGDIVTRNSNVAIIKEGCTANRADFADSPQLREVRDGYHFKELKISRSPNVAFGIGSVDVLIVPDGTAKEDLSLSPKLKNIRYKELYSETAWRQMHECPARPIYCSTSPTGTEALKKLAKRETSLVI